MRPNLALLAARLSGRPLLMTPAAAEAYGRQLAAVLDGERPRGFMGWLGAARRTRFAGEDELELPDRPGCYYPMWLERAAGSADGEGYGWTLKDGIALVSIDGPLVEHGFALDGETWLAGYECLAQTFAEIGADARAKAVFVRFDTPGGIAGSGLPALGAQLRALRAEKPVWASCDMAASAGYWLAANCSRVTAPALGYVGSIGAVMTHCDMSAMLEKDGLTVTQIQFGAKKTDGSPYKPLSASAKADWQAEIDDLGQLFVGQVLAGRPALTEEAVLGTEAGLFVASASDPERSALEIGLIDAVLDEPSAFAALSEKIAAAQAARTMIFVPKEAQMAETAVPATEIELAIPETPSLAQLRAAQQLLAGRIAGLEASEAPQAADPPADEDEDDDEGMEGDEGEETGGDPDSDDDDDESRPAAIAASPEAKANPQLALAAIEKGLSLTQFQAMAEVAPRGSARRGALRDFLGNAPRLGVDAPREAGQARPLFELAIADAKAKAERGQGLR